MEPIEAYQASWAEQNARDLEKNEARRLEAIAYAEHCARLLADKYGVRRVILYGSVLRENSFTDSSDIDISVEGLGKGDFFRALADLIMESPWNIDLKPLEEIRGLIKRRILNGKVLYEKRENT